jgi:UDP-glucose 4-epimerase
MVSILAKSGYRVVTLDNLCTGFRDAVIAGEFIKGDLSDRRLLDQLFSKHSFVGVMHFAAHIEVGESVLNPSKYYRNNFSNAQNLLDTMVDHDVHRFIFSSTAAIFGEPVSIPIEESHSKNPINPYGCSKWMVEQLLEDYDSAYGLNSIALRYFNAAGADPEGRLGERHHPETHLIPLVLQAASGRRDHISVFGSDYDTPDGTCIRDYIHVNDLCEVHLLALQALLQGKQSNRYNLGNGKGYSVQEVIDTAARVTKRPIPIIHSGRREGDPARLVADSRRVKAELGWNPQYAELEKIIAHAWQWEQKLSRIS